MPRGLQAAVALCASVAEPSGCTEAAGPRSRDHLGSGPSNLLISALGAKCVTLSLLNLDSAELPGFLSQGGS